MALIDAIRDGAVTVYEWFRDLVWSLLSPLFSAVSDAVSAVAVYLAMLAAALVSLAPYLAFANAWVPVDLFFQLVAAYCTLWTSWTVYRVVKSWIPTVSGGG